MAGRFHTEGRELAGRSSAFLCAYPLICTLAGHAAPKRCALRPKINRYPIRRYVIFKFRIGIAKRSIGSLPVWLTPKRPAARETHMKTALKDKAEPPAYKAQPTIGGSTYVRPQDMEWMPTQIDKVSIKTLYENKELGESTVLLKLEPGAVIPFHKHPELEQAYVIEGSMYDHDGTCRQGEYVWRKANSFHDNRTDTGAVIFAVYRKQNVFVNNAVGYRTP